MRYFTLTRASGGLSVIGEFAANPDNLPTFITTGQTYTAPDALAQEFVETYDRDYIWIERRDALEASPEGQDALERWKAGDDEAWHSQVRADAHAFTQRGLLRRA